MHRKHILGWTTFSIIMLIILIIIINISVKNKTPYPALILIVIIFVIAIIILFWKLRFDEQWVAPTFKAVPLISFSNVAFLPVNKTLVKDEDYRVFNPNGIQISQEGEIVIAMRASNDKDSFPLLQVFDSTMSRIIRSGKINIIDEHPILQKDKPSGYEDMRIFQWKNEPNTKSKLAEGLYMIGVNIDRNPLGLPSMVLTKLNDFKSERVYHLKYKPLEKKPNKNWSPIPLFTESKEMQKEKTLGFVVDIDPLLIVKFDSNTGICVKAYEFKKQLEIKSMRNSTITYQWQEIPDDFQKVFSQIYPGSSDKKYVLMGHTKYIESEHNVRGKLIVYRHYFVIIDLNTGIVRVSDPFYVENSENPHIEYISGFLFNDPKTITITYGLRDQDSKYIKLTADNLRKLLELSKTLTYNEF